MFITVRCFEGARSLTMVDCSFEVDAVKEFLSQHRAIATVDINGGEICEVAAASAIVSAIAYRRHATLSLFGFALADTEFSDLM